MTNILTAIKSIINNLISDLVSYYKSKNRINQIGDALEYFIKDIFADTVSASDFNKKMVKYSEVFSYSGNNNNPPNFMLKNGDAIQFNQINSLATNIQLISSYPRSRLFYDDSGITTACRNCENWEIKDIIYIMAVTENSILKAL